MAVFTEILARIRGNLRQAELTAGESYYHLIRDVASGVEVDADDAAIVIETAGKTDSDFERDVATMGERIQAAEMLGQRQVAEREMRKAEADLATAQANLQAAVNKLRPLVEEAVDRRAHWELQILTNSGAESRLMATVLDPTILSREAELTERFGEVQAKLGPLEVDHRRHREMAESAENNALQFRRQIAASDRSDRRRGLEGDLERTEAMAERERAIVAQLERLIAPLAKERNEINRQRTELQKQKLTP